MERPPSSESAPHATSARDAFRDGARDVLPVLLGVLPFGTISGVTAVAAGLDVVQAIAISAVVFAGASQLAGIQLMAAASPLAVILVTTFFINLRFTMYSAALAPFGRGIPLGLRALMAYLLTDQAFAFSVRRYTERSLSSAARAAYYLGIGTVVWTVWMLASAAGAVLGAQVPAAWGLDFAIPLTFLALLVPTLRDRPALLAAVVAAAVATLGSGLPYNLGLVLAALAGITAGTAASLRDRPRGSAA